MYIRRINALNEKIAFRSLSEQAEETALIDSGATENFINHKAWGRLGIGKRLTQTPLTVYNVDGSENNHGKITHYCWLRIIYQGKQRLQKFFIASLGKDSIILGYPFLYVFNPTIDWQQGKVKEGSINLQTPRYKYRYRDIAKVQKEAIARVGKPGEEEAIYMRRNIAQEWAREAVKEHLVMTTDTIPEEYKRHAKVFSEEESKRFPPA